MPGIGPVPAPLAIVSDGPLGPDLDRYLTILALRRANVFCTTLASLEELWLELEMVEPDVIVTVGEKAMRAILGTKTITLDEARGLAFDCHGVRVFPVYALTTEASDPVQRAFLQYDFQRLALYLIVSGLLPRSAVRTLLQQGGTPSAKPAEAL